jgi:hypothetical protein
MGVDRVDYLFWGVKLSTDDIEYDEFEDEIYGAPNARFDIVYDFMSGAYAMVGKVIARSDPYEGIEFIEVDAPIEALDKMGLMVAVREAVPAAKEANFATYLFTHFH